MNCRPGDLAVIVSHDDAEDRCLLGAVVQVTKIDPDWWELVWEYAGKRLYDSDGVQLIAISDRFLRPIRAGGISDEEVRDLYLPKVPEAA